jgi:predicted kinase
MPREGLTDVERPVVVAVCGSPGAGKTTVASATARRLRVPFLTRDEIKTGLGLSSASVADDGVRFDRDFHIAGGPFSLRAEAVMVDAARLLAASRVSFVVESSVLSQELLTVLHACGGRVLIVHVVAQDSVIDRRLRARAAKGGAVDQQLASLFQRGEMKRLIFEPPDGANAVIQVDTSECGESAIDVIEAAVVALLTSESPGHPSPRRAAGHAHRPSSRRCASMNAPHCGELEDVGMTPDRSRSLEDLENDAWGDPPADATRLVRIGHQLRRKPIRELSVEDLRLLIGQQIGLSFLVPVALDVLKSDPLAEGDMYEGDLLRALLRVDSSFWAQHPQLAEHARAIANAVSDRPDWLDSEIERLPSS